MRHSLSVFTVATVTLLGLFLLFSIPATAQGGSGNQHFLYIESNLHVVQSYGVNYPFTTQDVTAAAGAPLAGSVSGGLTSFALAGNTEHVYFVSSNLHVNELYNSSSGAWSHNDVSGATGAPYPVLTSALTSFTDSVGEHVFALGANSHVLSFWYSYGSSKWILSDLTTLSGGTIAASGSPLTSFDDSFGEHVYYLGTNEHVCSLYYNFSNGYWVDQDITETAGAPPALSGTGITSFADSSGEHVGFVGSGQHIIQLYYPTDGSGWESQDLTDAAGAPLAASGSTLAGFSDGSNTHYGPGGEHFFYWSQQGSQTEVTELLYNGSGWTYLALTNPQPTPPPAIWGLPGYETGSGTIDYEHIAL